MKTPTRLAEDTRPSKARKLDGPHACGSETEGDGWPCFSSEEEEHEPHACGSETKGDGWPQFSSDEDVAVCDRVATGPAPSRLSMKQHVVLKHGLQESTKKQLPAGVRFRSEIGVPQNPKKMNNHKDLTIGTIRIEKKATKTIIQLCHEDRWRSVCAISTAASANHRRLIAEIFDLAVEQDWDEEAMLRQRALLLDEA